MADAKPFVGSSNRDLSDLWLNAGSALGTVCLAYVLLSMYLRKAHLVLRRSFAMMRGRHIWLVVAEKSELEVQRLCRRMDPKCVFVPDLVGPPVVDEPPKKRRRRR